VTQGDVLEFKIHAYHVGCFLSFFVLSQSACTDRLMWGGAMPDSMYNFPIAMFSKHQAITLHVSFRVIYSFFAQAE